MQTAPIPLRRLALSLTLASVAVIALTALMSDADVQRQASTLMLVKRAEPTQTVSIGGRVTYTLELTVGGQVTWPLWLIDYYPSDTILITATPGYTPRVSIVGEAIGWLIPNGFFSPPTTLSRTLVLSVAGAPRQLINSASANPSETLLVAAGASVWAIGDGSPDTCQRDIALVFDRSGSMQEDTRCYGCFHLTGEYPDGNIYPLPFENPDLGVVIHCEPSDPVNYDGRWYVSIEAEHYSSYLHEADYHWENTARPKTWWAMQRQPNRSASGPDDRGAWMMVGPHGEGVMYYANLGDIRHPLDFNTTPRLDYGFTVPVSDTYYVWMRAQGGTVNWSDGRDSRRRVHMGLNGTPMTTGQANCWGPYNDGADSHVWDGSCRSNMGWSWTRVLELPNLTADTPYTLNVWAAGQGFRLDKIVLTNDPRDDLVSAGRPLGWDYPDVPDAGPVETHGRTGWACDAEDPRFMPVHPLWGLDDLYDDFQPIRAAKESVKRFTRGLDPDLDQISFVHYSASSEIREELYCQERYGGCDDFENVVNRIEATYASGSTNIADALWDGIRVLMVGEETPNDGMGFPSKVPGARHYGRFNLSHSVVLMTDGQPDRYPSLPSGYGTCYSENLWPDQPGESTSQRRAKECVVWFAHQARDQGVVIYTIGLGARADNDLLAYVAGLTDGDFYFAPSASELDAILEEIERATTSDCHTMVQIAKQVTPEVGVNVGERLTYTLQTTLGGRIRPSLWLTDYLPTHTIFITATPGYLSSQPTFSESLVWKLPSGVYTELLTLTHTIVLSVTGGEVLTNTAIVADGEGLAVATADVTVSARPWPVYGLNKQVTPSPVVSVGQQITYTLLVTTNRPDLPATLTDTLPSDTAFVAASGDHAPIAPGPGETLNWPLAPGDFVNGQVMRELVLRVTGVPPDSQLTNRAGIAGAGDSVVLGVLPAFAPSADLIVSQMSHQPAQPTVGQPINFTVTVQNQGTASAASWLAVELYAKGSDFNPTGPPTGPGDHAGGWCADPPTCDHTRSEYVVFFHGLAPGQARSLNFSLPLDQAGDYQVYAQVDVDRVGGATEEYGAVLESDENNNVFSYGTVTVAGGAAYRLYLPLIVKRQFSTSCSRWP